MNKPFFRADQVGSLLRPPELIAARAQYQQGKIDKAALRQCEDAAIADVVKHQEQYGFEVVVDDEFRRVCASAPDQRDCGLIGSVAGIGSIACTRASRERAGEMGQ